MATPTNLRPEVPERVLYRVSEAMTLLSMSRSYMYEQIRAGRLRTVKQGRTRLVPSAAVAEYVQLLMDETGGQSGEAA